MATVIPKMTHPLSKYWEQPPVSKIILGKETCMMAQSTFNKLKEYSTTIPSGVYSGKMWKRERNRKWYLCWYGTEEIKDGVEVCPIHIRRIDII